MHTSSRLKVASLFSGCGVLDYGLTQAGHEIILQTESDDAAREVLAARFQGICQPRDAGMVEVLPADTDLLAASVVSAELEGSWRESWSKDSVASKLKQVLRLMKSSPRTPWVLIEASSALLESDGDGVPIICDLVSEFERLGYRWAHRTVAPVAFGVPDVKPRVVLVGSKHGDPRDVLLTEDAGAIAPFDAPGPDQAQAFVFNRQTDGRVRVFSDFVEGFYPGGASCVLMPGGGLTALEVHDAERLQGLPPGWTLTSRPPAIGTPVDNAPRWNALAASMGCVPATQWIGARLANPYKLKASDSIGVPFESPITVPWPPCAYNVGSGRCAAPVSPFPRATPGAAPPTLGAFVTPPSVGGHSSSMEVVTKETALDCVKALRAAGWQPPPQLIAVEVAAEAAIAAAAAAAAAQMPGAKPGEKRGSPALQDPVAAQAAALAALAPMMAAVQAADAGASLAGLGNPAAALAAAAAASGGAPRSKKSKTSAHGVNAHKEEPAEEEGDESEEDDPDDDSYTVANITLRSRKESQVVWAKLPGHPFWPGLKVDLKKDKVPPETMNMRKENEALVIFFGENSFGWVREDQVLDFKEAYAEKAREPIRNKARFNSALQEALNDIEKRGVAFVPPAIQQRGKSGGHHGHSNGHKDAKKDVLKKDGDGGGTNGEKFPVHLPTGEEAKARAESLVASAAKAIASGRLTTEGCACRVCANPASPKNALSGKEKGGAGAPVCLRIEAQKAAAEHPVGAMLTLQGEASVGHVIEIFWPLDDVHYGAKITSYDPVEMQHMVMYDADGVREYLCLWNEDVKVLDGPTPGEGPAPDAPRDHATQPGMANLAALASAGAVNGGGSRGGAGGAGGDEAGGAPGAKTEPAETEAAAADGAEDGCLEALMGLASDSSAPSSPAPSAAPRKGGQRAATNGGAAGSGSARLSSRQATKESANAAGP